MSLTNLFERIAGKQQKRQQEKLADYRDLVARIADGQEPDVEHVDHVLRESGQTLDQLREDVHLLEQRRRLREQYDQIEPLQAERQQLERKVAEADRVLETAQKQHEEATWPLHCRLAQIKQAVKAGEQARQQLIDTCADQDLLDELEAVTERQKVASRRRYELDKEIADLRAWVDGDQNELAGEVFPHRAEQLHERIEERTARADALDRELAGAEKEMADLEGREKAIREQMLEP